MRRASLALGFITLASFGLVASCNVTGTGVYHQNAELTPLRGHQIKVISANVHGFQGDAELGLRELIDDEKPDAVCLQEATQSGLLRVLRSNEEGVMAPTLLTIQGEIFGNAFISPHKIEDPKVKLLPARGDMHVLHAGKYPLIGNVGLPVPTWLGQPRNTLDVTMPTEGLGKLHFLVSHASYLPSEQKLQLQEIANRQAATNAVLCADANLPLVKLVHSPLSEGLINVPASLPHTFPSDNPTATIDIVASRTLQVVSARAKPFGSDHQAQIVILDPAPDLSS